MSEPNNWENKNFLDRFFSSIGTFLENFFTWKGELKKFIEWTNKRGLKIEKIEGSSYGEAGFSFWETSKNSSCAKMIITNSKGETQGLYLMAYMFADAGLSKYRFVPAEEIKFDRPYRIVVTRLIPIPISVENSERQ